VLFNPRLELLLYSSLQRRQKTKHMQPPYVILEKVKTALARLDKKKIRWNLLRRIGAKLRTVTPLSSLLSISTCAFSTEYSPPAHPIRVGHWRKSFQGKRKTVEHNCIVRQPQYGGASARISLAALWRLLLGLLTEAEHSN